MNNSNSCQIQNHFLDLSPNLMCIVKFNGDIQYLNSAWETLLGYSKDEILSQTFLNFIFSNGLTTKNKEDFNLLEGKLPLHFESTLYCKTNSFKNIKWAASPKPEEKIIYFIGEDITAHKLSEDQLLVTANLYRNLYNQTPAMVHSIGRDGCLLAASDLWLKNMGFEREDIIGKKSIEFLTPESQKYAKEIALPAFFKNGQIKDVPYDFVTKKGKIINTLLSAIAEYDENGNIKQTLAVIIDVSLHNKAKEELKNEKAFSESVMNVAKDIIYIFDPETGKAIYWNQAIMDIMNLSFEEVKEGLAGSGSFHRAEDLNKIEIAIKDCIKYGQSNVQVDAMVKNKFYIPIDYNLSLIERGKKKKLICVIGRDITKTKQAEKLLRQSNHLLEASQSIAHVGGWELDIATNELFWTAETYRIHDTSPEEYNPTLDAGVGYFLPESRRIISEALQTAMEKGKGYDLVLETYTTKGRKIDVRTTCEVSFMKGKPSKLTGIFQDITTAKRIENDLINAKDKAEESDRLKSAFLANMSHEIRTPMNGILGFTDLLKTPNLSGEKQQKYINIIEKSGARMLTTIHNIIDISIIESDQIQITLSDVDLNLQMDELYEFFNSEAEIKNIQLSLKKGFPNQDVIIKTDQDKLNSILTNLIKNAIKFTNSGNIDFSYSIDKSSTPTSLQFSVIDTGIGIPKEKQKIIFQRFIQADAEDRMAHEGSGLGLSIASAYAEKLGGKIQVESQVGIGSHFTFTLPLNKSDLKES